MASLKLKESITNKEYKSRYLKGVNFLKQLPFENGFELTDEKDLHSDKTDNMYFLTKVQCKEEGNVYSSQLLKTTTFITAFYIPEECEFIRLYFNELISGYCMKEKSISVILEESKIIPSEIDPQNILCMSKQPKQCFNQQETLLINNKVYKRVVLCHPIIPMNALIFSDIHVYMDVPTFYIEHIRIHGDKIRHIEPFFDWVCVTPNESLVRINSGKGDFIFNNNILSDNDNTELFIS